MKKFATAIGLLTVLISGTAVAVDNWSSNNTTIDHIQNGSPDGNTAPDTYLGFSVIPNSRPACTNPSPLSKVVGTAENIKSVTTVAMAAYLAGRPVRVNWLNCSGSYAQIIAIKML